jgi:ABC-type Na+ transport system ATPase subunit NatA
VSDLYNDLTQKENMKQLLLNDYDFEQEQEKQTIDNYIDRLQASSNVRAK